MITVEQFYTHALILIDQSRTALREVAMYLRDACEQVGDS
jgi:hypothetical protein